MKSLKTFREDDIKGCLEDIKQKLISHGIKSGQIRIQIEDAENSIFIKGNNLTETEPVIVSTGSGIMLFAKLDF